MLWDHFVASRNNQDNAQPAIVADEASVTYAELETCARQLAMALQQQGVRPGHVLLAYLENVPAFVVAQLATALLGCTFAPLDVGSTPAEIDNILALTQSDLVICSSASLSRCQTFSRNVLAVDAQGKVESIHVNALPAPTFDASIGCIQFSSGSTGASKGILLSREAFYFRSHFLMTSLGLNQDDRTLCTLPLSHTHGAECLALPTLLAGGTLYLKSPRFSFPLYVLEELAHLRITFFSSIPQFYDFAVKLESAQAPDLSALRHPFCGSAALSRTTAERFYARYGVHIKQGYGLAELSVICINRHDHAPIVYDAIGTPLDGIEWQFQGSTLADALREGELVVRSKALFSGYLNNPEQTREKLQNGWFYTGDIVAVDNHGMLRVVGRKEDFIKINGFKVYAAEVESTIISFDGIRECAVLAERNDTGSERIVAYLVPVHPEACPEQLGKALIRYLRTRLSDYKIPKHCIVRAELPKNALGKILKSKIATPDLSFTRSPS